jgi:Uma2 family endonuclease
MVMSSITLVPVEEYLRYSEKPNCEYKDGVIYPKAMPTTFHSIVQYALLFLLRAQGVRALPELTVRISATKYLIPDVSVSHGVHSPYPTEPVQLCCEILSPEDRLGAMLSKCEEYHAWGVPYCWVIDPVKRTAWEYHAGLEPMRATNELRAGALKVGLGELFAELDTESISG